MRENSGFQMDMVAHACSPVWKTKAGRLIWPRSLRVAWATLQVSILKKKNKGEGGRGLKGREKGKREGRKKETNGGRGTRTGAQMIHILCRHGYCRLQKEFPSGLYKVVTI